LRGTSRSAPNGIKENAVTYAGSPRRVAPFLSADGKHQERDGVKHHYIIIKLDSCVNAQSEGITHDPYQE
jgi:hypothetical protein